MKIKPAVGYALSAIIFTVSVRLFCGVYTHDEYGEERFLKAQTCMEMALSLAARSI